MAYIVVGILVWLIAAFPIAILIGRAIHMADVRDPHTKMFDFDATIGTTATRI